MPKEELRQTPRTKLVRNHRRAEYDREVVNDIIDATPMCYVSYIIDGRPYLTPTFQWRDGDTIYWHGSSASRFLRQIVGKEVCMVVTLFDGLVLARSAFHHSANYRSVMLFGEATQISDEDKDEHLKKFVDNLIPGRWETLRPMTDQEVKATTVFSMPIDEGSAKIRTGPPVDDDEDYELPIWAGVLPMKQVLEAPEPDPKNLAGLEVPEHVRNFELGKHD
ncbi:MAG: pyridoxamine 5'-phosphate oxidase family protein [SAR202 cluster bacterium]|nr:flavin-nucleotide-binding protein [Chloroflexota bacterium]MQF94983.1 pyridoxamine 5'-phosphate oxidase family protein [SAR202 cluster bacterium]MQG34157.1 pyridoxamine 5'-phosphate oxidase family protein [SAR202 cluster bacterium]HAA94499.1 flavin-nucleotide-binding protein [Dehalococcoidia bacterium]HCP23456.1 flavin-nucleotide-binding protein [Dehalococcoidia bacterium]|tara:strand:+ start:2005 stop:2667 length:663 start_codon:yes stop_codon:yes gene_type:complete